MLFSVHAVLLFIYCLAPTRRVFPTDWAMSPADVRKAARFGPTAIFLGLFYVVVCFLYFRNSLQGSGYLTKLAPAQRTLTQLLAPLAAAAGVDEQDAQDVLEAAKDRWLSDDMLNVTVAALTPHVGPEASQPYSFLA